MAVLRSFRTTGQGGRGAGNLLGTPTPPPRAFGSGRAREVAQLEQEEEDSYTEYYDSGNE